METRIFQAVEGYPGKDRELVRRALEGDQRAFAGLYRTHHPRVYRIIICRTEDRDEAEDLVQVTFMRAFQALESFRGDAAFSTWLTQIALNVCASHRRAQRVRQDWLKGLEDLDAAPRRERKTLEDPEEATRRRERQELVAQGIQALPAPYREAMWLRYVQDRSYLEITQALQAPMGTVKTWLCRARRQLMGELQKLFRTRRNPETNLPCHRSNRSKRHITLSSPRSTP
jgi:RNA polymerase sigma-70 factor (ECF subfamily)